MRGGSWQGPLAKAEQFFSASESVTIVADGQSQMADAGVSLLILCGIAASDVICCARTGRFAQGESHDAARTLA